MVLRPRDVRRVDGRLQATIRRKDEAVLTALSRPVVFIETPADWVGPVELWFDDGR